MSASDKNWLEWLVQRLGGPDQLGDWVGDLPWVFNQGGLAVTLVVGAMGWLTGYLIERRHLVRLAVSEDDLRDISITQTRAIPAGFNASDSALLVASVVLSRGVFRTLIVTFRKLIGGRIPGYALLLERARREALVRLKAAARERGAPVIINLRFETTRISRRGMPVVEVVAYGTALRNDPTATAQGELQRASV